MDPRAVARVVERISNPPKAIPPSSRHSLPKRHASWT